MLTFCNVAHSSIYFCFTVGAPKVTTHPQSGTKTEGKNVTLFCNASGNPPLKLSWTIDGSPVNAIANHRISLSSNKTELTITNVSRMDSGQYLCEANNIIGNAISNVAKLDVQCKFTVLYNQISVVHQE